MWIHLLRHGIAIDRADPQCPPDPERPLTERGIKRTRDVARGLRRLGVEPNAIVVSPYIRARQTAEIAAKELGYGGPLRTTEALTPYGEPPAVVSELNGIEGEVIMCVGHAPNLDNLVSHLVGHTGAITFLKKAGVASIEVPSRPIEAGTGYLHAVFPPRALRALAE